MALGQYVFAAFTAFVLFYGVFALDACGIMRRSGWSRL